MFRTRFQLVLVAAALSTSGVACDDAKPSAPAPSASALAVAQPKPEAPSSTASAAPSAEPARVSKRKDPASCPKGDGPVAFDDPTLEAVVRRQLQKPSGP